MVPIAAAAMLALLLLACQTEGDSTQTVATPPEETPSPDKMITLGDIDADEPAKKIFFSRLLAQRLKPLQEKDNFLASAAAHV